MKIKASLLAALLVMGGFAAHSEAEVISRTELAPGNDYCHLKFPAIAEQTLTSDRPVLKGSESADIIDFYGKCDESPTGEVRSHHNGAKNAQRATLATKLRKRRRGQRSSSPLSDRSLLAAKMVVMRPPMQVVEMMPLTAARPLYRY